MALAPERVRAPNPAPLRPERARSLSRRTAAPRVRPGPALEQAG